MNKRSLFLSRYLPIVLICIIWCAIQLHRYHTYGIFLTSDSHRNLAEAHRILSGGLPSSPVYFLYFSYELFVAFFVLTGLGTPGIIITQLGLSLIAAGCIFKLASALFDSRAGFIAALFYVAYPRIHIYNFTILTESLFISLTIISIYCISVSRLPIHRVLSGLLLIFTSTIRPHGIFLLCSVFLYFLYTLFRGEKYWILATLSCAAFILVLVSVKVLGETEHNLFRRMVDNFMGGNVFYRYHPVLEFEGEAPVFDSGDNSFIVALQFMAANYWYIIKLGVIKLWYYFLFIRPFFSFFHNLFSVVTFVPVYLMALLGVFSRSKITFAKFIMISFCFFQALVAFLTLVDTDGRHLLPILPIIFIFAARGTLELPYLKKPA